MLLENDEPYPQIYKNDIEIEDVGENKSDIASDHKPIYANL